MRRAGFGMAENFEGLKKPAEPFQERPSRLLIKELIRKRLLSLFHGMHQIGEHLGLSGQFVHGMGRLFHGLDRKSVV